MNTDDIIKLALELGKAVASSDEIENLKAKQAIVTQDKNAYDLIMRYQDTRNKVENKNNGAGSGLILGKTDEDLLNILEQQINSNAVIQELMAAQQKFDNLMQGVYFAMNQAISGNSGEDGGCSGGCESCSSSCGLD